MQAFKFRSGRHVDHIMDVLHNRRLYCAHWSKLNDPMEAIFAYSRTQPLAPIASRFAADVQEKLKGWRVCSLSETFDSHLLWAHYANGFDGVAIQVQLPDNDADIRRVRYGGVFAGYNYDRSADAGATARSILFSKYQEWSYEREIRILSDQEFYYLPGPIKRVIAGHRLQEALSDTIQLVCERLGIEFCRLGIGDEGLDADYAASLQNRNHPLAS